MRRALVVLLGTGIRSVGPEATGKGAGLLVNMLSAPARAEKGEGKEAKDKTRSTGTA